jgi:nitrogen fixation NifU-like protein
LFTDQVIDHFSNPRNVGVLDHPDGIGTVGDPMCGDLLELQIQVQDGIITDVRFKVRGCVAAIASSSMTTVLIKGKTLEEASLLTDRMISEALGGLPDFKMHCSVWAHAVTMHCGLLLKCGGEKQQEDQGLSNSLQLPLSVDSLGKQLCGCECCQSSCLSVRSFLEAILTIGKISTIAG